jgi:hypothetical protein
VEELRALNKAISIHPATYPGEVKLNVSEFIYHVETKVTAVILLFEKNLRRRRRKVGISSADRYFE